MSNLFEFLIRYKNTLLFLILLTLSLFFTFQTHSYQKSKVISSTNFISGRLYTWESGLSSYFHLKKTNRELLEENIRLRQKILNDSITLERKNIVLDTAFDHRQYEVLKAKVIANRYSDLDNYLLLNKGKKDEIEEELGVFSDRGVVGIVERTSSNYARIISILNTKLDINAQLKKSDHFGTLTWDGNNPNIMLLTDIPRAAEVEKNDTIMTNGRSLIFPKGILIGTVEEAVLRTGQNYYDIKVKLFNDMTSLRDVYILKNNQRTELDSLRVLDEK